MAAPPRFAPLPLIEIPVPFDSPDWLFELKHDGFRALAYLRRGQPAELVSRTGKTYTAYAPLCAALGNALPLDAILDGELVCLDDAGRSIFSTLMFRRAQPVFYAFDLLWSSGDDLRHLALIKRKSILRGLLPMGAESLLVGDHVVGRGVELFGEVCAEDLEGIVGKPLGSPYRLVNGKSPWVKVKNPGCSQAVGRAELFNRRRGR